MPVAVGPYSSTNPAPAQDIKSTSAANDNLLHTDDAPQGVIAAKGQDVQRIVDETLSRIRQQSDWLQQAASPYADTAKSFAERRPVLFTFLLVWTAFSALPVGIFLGFVLSTAAVVIGVAATGIFVSLLSAIIIGGVFLVPVLFITTLISLTIITGLLSLFLLHRLVLHLSASTTGPDGRLVADYTRVSSGVRAWANETTSRLPEAPFDTSSIPFVGKSTTTANSNAYKSANVAPTSASAPRSTATPVPASNFTPTANEKAAYTTPAATTSPHAPSLTRPVTVANQ